ncbi:MAG: DNA topoisomerase 1 [Planctomycetaceae bacterium]|nr:MAG: DNA topoisomerase 1 [Planctomycetaceae bacterium]
MAKKHVKGLVIVESPAKARKISDFLGNDYVVKASMGHVRDLPEKAADIPPDYKKVEWARKFGVNIDNNFEPLYVVPKERRKIVKELKEALQQAQELYVATDEDREGESIGWHLTQLLQPKVPVKRMVFSEITRDAILNALRHPRELDERLVEAQETRRILDRLYGYTLSPLLWKKIARKLSAGRVQSVAVRMLVHRELERMAFRKSVYWDLKALLENQLAARFEAVLLTLNGRRVASGRDFDEHTGQLKPEVDAWLLDESQAQAWVQRLKASQWRVLSVETRLQQRKPAPPFITSTLQQEANRKLGYSARETMQIAQRLYEEGYITYMRTDSVHLSQEAIDATRRRVVERYGREYLHDEVRQFVTRQKNAQEAHEAIRPAGTEMKTAEEHGLTGREAALYALIWKRTMATQMAEARLRFQTVIIEACERIDQAVSQHSPGVAEFRAVGRHVEFPGFFMAYVEGSDDPEAAFEEEDAILPPLKEGEQLTCLELEACRHETKPPPRYTEATLVRALETEGIGRPSTYASIISTILDRGYAVKQAQQLIPTFTAFAVTRLLERHFPKLVDLGFTAEMEQRLDDISNGQAERVPYLREFFLGEQGLQTQVAEREKSIDAREACTLELQGLEPKIRVGKFGPYLELQQNGQVITASLPPDITPSELTNQLAEQLLKQKQQGPASLGNDPETGLPVFIRKGPFGPYVQLGEATNDQDKPKRVSLPRGIDLQSLTLDQALAYLKLPRVIGIHPETQQPILAGIGRFGPYVQHQRTYKSLAKQDDVLTISLSRALELLSQARRRAEPTPLRVLGDHPEDGQPVAVYEGRYGHYVKHGQVNATIPKDVEPTQVTLEQALGWLAERRAKGESTRGRRGTRRTTTRSSSEATMSAAARQTRKRSSPTA